jgi:hypothetical protein
MKAYNRIPNFRKHSKIAIPKRNLWFNNEEILMNEVTPQETKSIRNDRASFFNDDYTKYSQGNSEVIKPKKECRFVVDWQLE